MQYKYMAIEIVQWIWILGIGLFTSTRSCETQDLHKISVAIVSMVLGTVVSFYVKKWLNDKYK